MSLSIVEVPRSSPCWPKGAPVRRAGRKARTMSVRIPLLQPKVRFLAPAARPGADREGQLRVETGRTIEFDPKGARRSGLGRTPFGPPPLGRQPTAMPPSRAFFSTYDIGAGLGSNVSLVILAGRHRRRWAHAGKQPARARHDGREQMRGYATPRSGQGSPMFVMAASPKTVATQA